MNSDFFRQYIDILTEKEQGVRTGPNPNIDDETRNRARQAVGADSSSDASRKSQSSGSAATGTTIQSDDDGYHMITTPDGKTVVAGPDDGKGPKPPTAAASPAAPTAPGTPAAPKPPGTGSSTVQGPKIGYENPGTRAFQNFLNSVGFKVAVDGKYGPETQAAGRKYFDQLQSDPKSGKPALDKYFDMLSVGTAYNVIPAPGKDYVWLNGPIYLEKMKKHGYDPKTGNPIGGQAGSPGGAATRSANPQQVAKLTTSLDSIEAILAKYKIKTNESLDPVEQLVIENINQFTPAEQMQIWALLSEKFDISGNDAYAQMQRDMDARAARERVRSAYRGSQDAAARYNQGASTAPQSKLDKFVGKLGGARGIANKAAARLGGSMLGGPLAPFIAAGSIAYTAFDIGKAIYDTFADKDALAQLDDADQAAVKQQMATIVALQRDQEFMNQLDPELKKRLENALKGLNKLAVDTGFQQSGQSASPAVDQKTTDRVRDASGPVSASSQTSGIRIANEPVIPGQPLSSTQMRVMKMAIDMGNTYPPEIMAQYRRQSRDF